MKDVQKLFREGALSAAVDAAAAAVRARPADTAVRGLYTELLCFDGQLERADAQLETLLRLDTSLAVGVGNWRQIIRAAQMRADVFQRGAAPGVTGAPGKAVTATLQALTALREGDSGQAAALCAVLEAARPTQPRQVNGRPVEDFRDLDDIMAGLLEVLASNGRYYWVAMDDVLTLELDPPRRPLDLLWRPARLALSSGIEGKVFLPALYPQPAHDEAQKLGRSTDWLECDGLCLGRGQRMWLAGDQVLALQDLERVEAADDASNRQQQVV